MEQFKLELDSLIYLDVEFVALKYEELTGNTPSSQLTKTEGVKAVLGIPMLSVGVHRLSRDVVRVRKKLSKALQ